MKRQMVLGLLMGCGLILAGCGIRTEGAVGEPAAGTEEIITIIHVNDIHGYVEASDTAIGYAKTAAFIDAKKAENSSTLALDAGDTFSGSPTASFDKGESIVPILNTISFDAMTLGNHDFYLGEEQVISLISQLHYPALAGNVKSSQSEAWGEYTIIELDSGTKVGIVSAATNAPAGAEYLDAVTATQGLVDEVKQQADVVIALTHLGLEEPSGNTSQRIANEVSGIDLIIDGHSHTVLEEGMVVNDVLTAQTGEYGNHIGMVELTLKDKTVVSAQASLLSKEAFAEIEEKEATKQAVADLLAKSEVYFAEVIGATSVDLTAARELVRTGETNLGNLYADAMREALGAELSLCAAGNIGGEIPAGNITKKDLLSIVRADVTFTLIEVSGKDLLVKLNELINEFPEPSGKFLQVSGITYEFNPALEAGRRITKVTVGGEVLDEERIYRAAITTGLVGAFDGAAAVAEYPDSSMVIIEEYIKAASPVSPEIEGRITAIAE